MSQTKSANKNSIQIEHKIVRWAEWENYTKVREFVNNAKNTGTLKIMDEDEERRLTFMVSLQLEGRSGWQYCGFDNRYGLIFARQVDNVSEPDLAKIFTEPKK